MLKSIPRKLREKKDKCKVLKIGYNTLTKKKNIIGYNTATVSITQRFIAHYAQISTQ